MKKEIADKWVEALRSGNYKQGMSALRSKEDEYCCLGVLCEVLGLEAKISIHNTTYIYDGRGDLLPRTARELANMKSENGSVYGYILANSDNELFSEKEEEYFDNNTYPHPYPSRYNSLSEVNDDGITFDRIADFIEKNYQLL